MGATQSGISRTKMDSGLPNNNDGATWTPPPELGKVETFDQKLYRKFTQQPLIPAGCLLTTYFLGSGIKSFYNRDPIRSQKMMRARVGAQFATLAIFVGSYGMGQFNLSFAPGMMPDKEQKGTPKNEEELEN